MRALPLLLALAACGTSMDTQPKYHEWESAGLFRNGRVVQAPPAGTVERSAPAALATQPPRTLALMERGRQRYGIYCQPCHGSGGDGDGMIVQRGFSPPPSFHTGRLIAAPDAHYVEVITRGWGAMYSYADRVSPADRWAIAAFIRAMQASKPPVAAATRDLAPGAGESGPQDAGPPGRPGG
ncbi:MAG: c-type cytochrome [Janthinobacterium lividum]